MLEIYYAEDDLHIAQAVNEYLEQRNFRVEVFPTLREARQALRSRLPALLLVDWNMPDGHGGQLCLWAKERWPNLPLIFLTVRQDAEDIVWGLQNGADDYVTKPFELSVLHARILALLRRAASSPAENPKLICGDFLLDQQKQAVFSGSREIPLSQLEYGLFLALMENIGRTLPRAQLLERIWDSSGNYVNDNTLTVTVKRLREKLGNPPCLKTIRSFGYRMEEP